MKKDYLLSSSDWCKHTRNSSKGKRGINREIRRKVRQQVNRLLVESGKTSN